MKSYTFRETIQHLSERMGGAPLPEEKIPEEGIELVVGETELSFISHPEGFTMCTELGSFTEPPNEQESYELASSNFLGIRTGGCTLTLKEGRVGMRVTLPATTLPSAVQEWVERLVFVSLEWQKILLSGKKFLPSIQTLQPEAHLPLTHLHRRV